MRMKSHGDNNNNFILNIVTCHITLAHPYSLRRCCMPKDISTTTQARCTTTYKPPTGHTRLYGFAPIRGMRKTPSGVLLDRRFTGPVEKIEEPISEGDTTQWDI